jgi:hypothetical protein
MPSSISGDVVRPPRRSAFREIGLVEGEDVVLSRPSRRRPALKVRFRSKNDIFEPTIEEEDEWKDTSASSSDDDTSIAVAIPRFQSRPTSSDRFALVAFVIIISTMIAQLIPLGKSKMLAVGAATGAVAGISEKSIGKRQASDPTDYCKKWSQQSAIVNGTMYLYGGRKTTSASQTSNTWSMLTKWI